MTRCPWYSVLSVVCTAHVGNFGNDQVPLLTGQFCQGHQHPLSRGCGLAHTGAELQGSSILSFISNPIIPACLCT